MEASDLRREFAAFCGDGLYHRFVRAINKATRSKRRLLFWQERLWSDFVVQNANAGRDLAGRDSLEVASLFHVCDIHDCELSHGPAPVVGGLVYFPDEYLDAREMAFPFANPVALQGCTDISRHESAWEDNAEVEYCPECRRQLAAWREEHELLLAGADF